MKLLRIFLVVALILPLVAASVAEAAPAGAVSRCQGALVRKARIALSDTERRVRPCLDRLAECHYRWPSASAAAQRDKCFVSAQSACRATLERRGDTATAIARSVIASCSALTTAEMRSLDAGLGFTDLTFRCQARGYGSDTLNAVIDCYIDFLAEAAIDHYLAIDPLACALLREAGVSDALPGACPSGCGDGIANGDEQCDGGDDAQCPGDCTPTCECPAVPECGNGIVDGADECDPPGSIGVCAARQACGSSCTCPSVDVPLAISTPTEGGALRQTLVAISGTTEPGAAVVCTSSTHTAEAEVETAGGFSVNLELDQGHRTIVCTATVAGERAGEARVSVLVDTLSPSIAIAIPEAGSLVGSQTSVSGHVNDLVPGSVNDSDCRVTCNGVPAEVSQRTFLARDVPVSEDEITCTAEDRAGNGAAASVPVKTQSRGTSSIRIESGNLQAGPIRAELEAPLVVELLDDAGLPKARHEVVFRVVQGDGLLRSVSGPPARIHVGLTDDAGRAVVYYQLGSRSGVANNLVEVSAAAAEPVTFQASGLHAAGSRIHVDSGFDQQGVPGQPLGEPMRVVVTDEAGNRVAGAEVSFRVLLGGGTLHGAEVGESLVVVTDDDGAAEVVFILGLEEGPHAHLLEASLGDVPGAVASFYASAHPVGPPEFTSIGGVVLDNVGQPIEGVTVSIDGTETSARTTESGHFVIGPAPVGPIILRVNGTTSDRPGSWPTLEFHLSTISGHHTTLAMPVYLLPLDETGLSVTATTGGTLTVDDLPGFSLTVDPGTATFPDGGKEGIVTVTSVNVDKIPMTPNFGQQPRFVVTIQPPGVLFDPPAPVTFPNLDGLAPGAITELYSFDHDLAQFISIGLAEVSEDGTQLVSLPGSGIREGGWHCGGNPAVTGNAAKCPDCMRCEGNRCQPDPNQDGNQCFGDKCRVCENGACVLKQPPPAGCKSCNKPFALGECPLCQECTFRKKCEATDQPHYGEYCWSVANNGNECTYGECEAGDCVIKNAKAGSGCFFSHYDECSPHECDGNGACLPSPNKPAIGSMCDDNDCCTEDTSCQPNGRCEGGAPVQSPECCGPTKNPSQNPCP